MISVTPDKSASCALIGYNNLVVSSTQAPEATSANTYQRYTPATGSQVAKFQLSTATAIDYIGIAAHNIGTHDSGTEIILSYAATVGGALTEITRFTPGDNGAIFKYFTEISGVAEIAVTTNATTTGMEIGVVAAGIALRMEQPIYGGHRPLELNYSTEYQNSVSESGQFLGRTVKREGASATFDWQHLNPDWVRVYLKPFILAATTQPFFIQWRPDLYDSAAYCHTTADIQPSNMGGGSGLMQVSISVRAHSDV